MRFFLSKTLVLTQPEAGSAIVSRRQMVYYEISVIGTFVGGIKMFSTREKIYLGVAVVCGILVLLLDSGPPETVARIVGFLAFLIFFYSILFPRGRNQPRVSAKKKKFR